MKINEINKFFKRSSVTQTTQNGITTETRIHQENGQEIVETYENGILKSRIINGVLQALPSTSQEHRRHTNYM